ncbi:MAG TPA: fluoride efflux transporter CrcB [Pirellulales bacterium]|nr:fluoride efflux transporter CrcB [Pirellulales bacterium]
MPDAQFSFLKPTLIFLGSGSGGLLRYWLGGIVQNWWGPTFPLGTLIVNVSGCLAMGFIATAWTGPVLIREEYRAAMLIGVLGGYTTFSSFSRETLTLARDGEWWRAGAYILGSVALSLVAVWLGSAIAAKLYGTGAP